LWSHLITAVSQAHIFAPAGKSRAAQKNSHKYKDDDFEIN